MQRADHRIPASRWITGLIFAIMASAALLCAQTMDHHAMAMGNPVATKTADIVRDPADVPPPVGNRAASVVHVTLTAQEVIGTLDPANGTTYRYWTFNGKVPGPMIRVRQGDSIEVTMRNDPGSHMAHSVDFHAAVGPGGGAALSQTMPGQSKTFTFQANTPGLFVYHCGTPMIGDHIANGMYGLILVEPPEGLPHVDHEYYVMQGEIYTAAPRGKPGLQQFSGVKLLQEAPEYYVFNGAVDALTKTHPMHAKVGETVRLFFGDAGPNATSSMHMVGNIFSKDYDLGSWTSTPLTGVQTASVPPGGAAMLEVTMSTAGKFPMMDHAMSRMPKGLMALVDVAGEENAHLMHAGPAIVGSDPVESAHLTGMTATDVSEAASRVTQTSSVGNTVQGVDNSAADPMAGMDMGTASTKSAHNMGAMTLQPTSSNGKQQEFNGCLRLQSDGKAMLKVLNSSKVYRLEGRPLQFSENANRIVHVAGQPGSVVADEDPNIPSFVVDSVDQLARTCSAKLSAADIRKALLKTVAVVPSGTVRMNDMGFFPPTITVNAGDKVTWTNSSQVFHNVVDDASKALSPMDVSFPSGGKPFDSGLMQPGQTFSRVFTVPGVYHYVCTLHEGNGMKGVVIVKPTSVLSASK